MAGVRSEFQWGTRSHIGVRSALGRSMRCVKCENKRVSVGRGCINLSPCSCCIHPVPMFIPCQCLFYAYVYPMVMYIPFPCLFHLHIISVYHIIMLVMSSC